MSALDDGQDEHLDDSLLRAVARTPAVTPFLGTARYRVCRCLGEGGFGVVYEVVDLELGRQLALKTLKPRREGFGASMLRFKSEFRSVADLAHRNIVGLHELSTEDGRWFFTMDLIRGTSFLDHVAGSMSRLRAALRQLVGAVIALHGAGVVHRDLKPQNVLVEPSGRVVILDFGLARDVSEAATDAEDDEAGTPAYMAPEQRAGLAVTPAADWYAVGVMLYEALTGSRPAPDSVQVAGGGAPDLERLCIAMLRRDAAARPNGAAILASLGDPPPCGPLAAMAATEGDASPFVGRRQELEVLEAGLRAGTGQLRVRGQPGVGKSALLARFVDDAKGRGVVLVGRCYERESVPFKAFDGVADVLARYLQGLPPHEAAALLPRDIHLLAQLFPVFEGIGRGQGSPPDPREARARAFAALKELFARLAAKQPLVVVIDDLQWGDIDGARLLAHLMAPPDRPAMLFVLAYRDDADASPTLVETLRMLDLAGGPSVELLLDRMDAAEAEQLARRSLRCSSDGAARAIAQRAEGHPLFIVELARAHEVGMSTSEPPPTLIEFLCRRLSALPDSALAALETVAVAGQPLPWDVCIEAAGLGSRGWDALRTLRAEQLTRTTEGGAVNVFHDRIRDAVLLFADRESQRRRHRALASALELRPEADPETLARHYDAAGERELTCRYAVRAADAAVDSLAFDRAAALYRLAIERGASDASGALHEKLATALLHAGSNVASGEAYLAAAALADGDRATELARRAAEQLLVVGNVEVGFAALERALAAVGERLPTSRLAARLEMFYHLARLHLSRWRYREATTTRVAPRRLLRLDVLESAAKGIYQHDPPRSLAIRARFCRAAFETGEQRRVALGLIHSIYAFAPYRSSRPSVMDDKLDLADAIATKLDDPSLRAQVELRRGGSYFVFGDWARAAPCLEEAAALVAEQCIGMATEHRWALMQAGNSYLRLGALEAARRLGDELLLDAMERGDPVAEKGVCVGVLAPLSLAGDEVDAAATFVARGGFDDRCATVLLRSESEALVAMYRGRPDEAVAAWRRSWSRVEQVRLLAIAGFRVLAVRSLATALLASVRRDLGEANRLVRSLRGLRFPYGAAVSASLEALVSLRGRGRGRAIRLLEDAAAQFEAAGMVLDAAACRYRAGELAQRHDRQAAARDELRERGIASPERWVAMVLPTIA